MNRLNISINGAPAGAAEINAACKAAKPKKLRKPKDKGRKHRKLSDADRAAKEQRTAQARKARKAAREAKELEQLLRRVKAITARAAREQEKAGVIHVSYKPGREPRFEVVCPLSLYSRIHPQLTKLLSKRAARTSSDGYRNIVFKKTSRGYGKKKSGRAYSDGEAGDMVRYIFRPDGLEECERACFSNLIATSMISSSGFGVDEQAQMVAFFDALEEIEKAARKGSNVFSHFIIPMPYEMGSGGRSAALEKLCTLFEVLDLPYAAALHKPDPGGNQRNFHAHIVIAFRGFQYEGPFAWAFDPDKASEFNTPAGLKWMRERVATAFNAVLSSQRLDIKYSGLSQAERRVASATEFPKGQAVVAAERRLFKEIATARRLLNGVMLRVCELIRGIDATAREIGQTAEVDESRDRLRREKAEAAELKRKEDEAEAAERLARKRRDEEQLALSLSAPVEKEVSSTGKRDTAERRVGLLEAARISHVTEAVEILHVALRHVDAPRLVLTQVGGGVRAVYRPGDRAIAESLDQISKERDGMEWLKGLAAELTFDHAAVPVDWLRADLFRDHTSPAVVDGGYWASEYGGAERPTPSQPAVSVPAPARLPERPSNER